MNIIRTLTMYDVTFYDKSVIPESFIIRIHHPYQEHSLDTFKLKSILDRLYCTQTNLEDFLDQLKIFAANSQVQVMSPTSFREQSNSSPNAYTSLGRYISTIDNEPHLTHIFIEFIEPSLYEKLDMTTFIDKKCTSIQYFLMIQEFLTSMTDFYTLKISYTRRGGISESLLQSNREYPTVDVRTLGYPYEPF